MRHSAISVRDPVSVGSADWKSPHVLSIGDKGRPFNASLLPHLTALNGEPNDQRQKLASWTPTFVTAASDNHFRELRGMVHNMHSTYPQARFVVYDLGLTEEQGADARRWCNARYVSFDFGRYPEHEQLNELGTFFWLDASPRLTCPDLSIFPRAVLNGSVEPFVTFGHSEHSIFAATHPGMLEYFPVDDVELLKVTEVKYATAMFVSDSAYTRMVLKWVVLCALTNDCIAPDGHYLYCKFKHRYRDYGNCHRYDQSAFALARLHLLYLRGHYKLLARADHVSEPIKSEANDSHTFAAEQLRTLSTEWERRYKAFASCFVLKGGDYYDGKIPACNGSSTSNKV